MRHKALIRRLQISCLGLDRIDPLCLLVDDVIEALRENAMREVQRLGQEIEQPKVRTGDCLLVGVCASEGHKIAPQRTWVGLTDEEIDSCFEDHGWSPSESYYPVIKDIEAKLKQKNHVAQETNS